MVAGASLSRVNAHPPGPGSMLDDIGMTVRVHAQ